LRFDSIQPGGLQEKMFMTDPKLRPPRKCVTKNSWETERVRDVAVEQSRDEFVAFRCALGWSRLRTAVELGVSETTVENWESRELSKNARGVPAWAHSWMRRKSQLVAGVDSRGKIKVAAG
jgi:ribosome-binding protein aMBF1 (putative translation factor)